MGVNDPCEVEAILKENEIAILLSDLSMPNMDGAEVIRLAYEVSPKTVGILVTGRASTDGLIRALNEGRLWKCLEKPWRPEQIQELVEGALSLYESRQVESGAPNKQKPAKKISIKGKAIFLTSIPDSAGCAKWIMSGPR